MRDYRANGEPREEVAVDASSSNAVLTVGELATLLRVDRKSAYEAIRRGQIPGVVHLGRSIRVSRDAVLAWLHGQGSVSRSRTK